MQWAGQAPPSVLETELDSPGLLPGNCICHLNAGLTEGGGVRRDTVSGTPYSVVIYNYFVYLYIALNQKWLKILLILISFKFCSLDWTLDNI